MSTRAPMGEARKSVAWASTPRPSDTSRTSGKARMAGEPASVVVGAVATDAFLRRPAEQRRIARVAAEARRFRVSAVERIEGMIDALRMPGVALVADGAFGRFLADVLRRGVEIRHVTGVATGGRRRSAARVAAGACEQRREDRREPHRSPPSMHRQGRFGTHPLRTVPRESSARDVRTARNSRARPRGPQK